MFLVTDKTEWLPPIHSMLTSYGSLNLLDLSRPEHVPFLVCDWVPDPNRPLDPEEPLLGEVRPWPNAIDRDWKHALSHDMIDVLNSYYTEANIVAGGELSIQLFHDRCIQPVDELIGPSVNSMSCWLTSIWMHEQYHSTANRAA